MKSLSLPSVLKLPLLCAHLSMQISFTNLNFKDIFQVVCFVEYEDWQSHPLVVFYWKDAFVSLCFCFFCFILKDVFGKANCQMLGNTFLFYVLTGPHITTVLQLQATKRRYILQQRTSDLEVTRTTKVPKVLLSTSPDQKQLRKRPLQRKNHFTIYFTISEIAK